MQTKKLVRHFGRIAGLALALAALLACASLSYAWLVSSVEPLNTDVTTAKVQIAVDDRDFKSKSLIRNALPGTTTSGGIFKITNTSTREIVLEVSVDVEGYLKVMDYVSTTVGTYGPMSEEAGDLTQPYQNINYLLADPSASLVPKIFYESFVTNIVKMFEDEHAGGSMNPITMDSSGDPWRTEWPYAAGYLLDTANLDHETGKAGNLYLRIDDVLTGGAITDYSSLTGFDKKIAQGSKHFNAIRKCMADKLMKSTIEQFVKEAGGDIDDIDFDDTSGLIYSDTNFSVYKPAETKFYVYFLDAPASGSQEIELDAEVDIPADLGGGVLNADRLDSKYWTYTVAVTERTPTYGFNENAYDDVSSNARLNEHGAMFRLLYEAKAVQGTKAAVTDVFGVNVANAFGL